MGKNFEEKVNNFQNLLIKKIEKKPTEENI